MGMFDYLRCEHPLPVSGSLTPEAANAMQFQTKDLDCTLDEYTITKGGELVGQSYNIEDRSDPNAEGLMALAGCMTRVNTQPKAMPDFIGEIRFYADYGPKNKNGWGEGWVEYSAYFRHGKLISVDLVEFREKPE